MHYRLRRARGGDPAYSLLKKLDRIFGPTSPGRSLIPSSKQFSVTHWKPLCARSTIKARIADYLDLRTRIDGLRKMTRAAMREKDAGLAISLNGQIYATVDKAQRLEHALSLHEQQKVTLERQRP